MRNLSAKTFLAAVALSLTTISAQTGTLNIVNGVIDFSGAAHTEPAKAGTAVPGTCVVGEIFFKTNATPGQNLYFCTATNVFTQQLNSGSATGGGVTVYSGTGLTLTGTLYFPIGGGATPSSTETNVDVDSPSAATVTNMYIQVSTAFGMGNSGVFTFRKNASSQSVTCTISGAVTTSCSDTTHSFSVSQGDLLTIQAVFSGTIVVTPNVIIAAQFGNITATGTVNNCATAGAVTYYSSTGTAVSCVGADITFNTHTLSTGANGIVDLSASSSASAFKVPNLAGASSTASGALSYDTTNKNLHAGANGADNFVMLYPSASPPTNGHCAQFGVASSVVTLADAGAPCGSGGSGGMTLVEQHTASNSTSLDFTTCISSTYDNYFFELLNLIPQTTADRLGLRMSTNGGSTYDSGANYSWDQLTWRVGGLAEDGGTGQGHIGFENAVGTDTTSTFGLSGFMYLYSPLSTSLYKAVVGEYRTIGSGIRYGSQASGAYEITTAANAVRFYFGTNNIASGTIRCYGLGK